MAATLNGPLGLVGKGAVGCQPDKHESHTSPNATTMACVSSGSNAGSSLINGRIADIFPPYDVHPTHI